MVPGSAKAEFELAQIAGSGAGLARVLDGLVACHVRQRDRPGLSYPGSSGPTAQEVGHVLLGLPDGSGESDEGDRLPRVRLS